MSDYNEVELEKWIATASPYAVCVHDRSLKEQYRGKFSDHERVSLDVRGPRLDERLSALEDEISCGISEQA